MTPQDNPGASDSFSPSEIEHLLQGVPTKESTATKLSSVEKSPVATGPEHIDFRNPRLLSASTLRKLRQHEDEFVSTLASRLSLYLRVEFTLTLTRLETISFQALSQAWSNPTHLTLFKVEPLRGISLLEIPPQLGLCMVDRLMGGPGRAEEVAREISEIERALLEQVLQIILGEWSNNWAAVKQLKPAILGHETNGNFVRTTSPETSMLILGMEARMGEGSGTIQFAFPYAALEPLIQQACSSPELAAEVAPTPSAMQVGSPKWNASLDEVQIPITLEWQNLEITARDIVQLKIGDVLQLNPQGLQAVQVRLADIPKFKGRLGTISGRWAAELSEII
jgi:flagellar motor switch protein FliM